MRGRSALIRRTSVFVVLVLLALVFTVRLLDLQVMSRDSLLTEAKGKRAVEVTIPSVRGDIVDRNGTVLATTDERYDVQLSPKNTRVNGGEFWRASPDGRGTVVVTTKQAFREIGEVTGQSAAEIKKIVDDALKKNPKSDFAYVKRSINLVQLNKLKELQIPWLTFTQQHDRSYPNGAVAGNIIGFVGQEDEPLAGIEFSQNKCLTGTDGLERYERGADQVPLPGSVVVEKQVQNGGTVKLTLERDLQWEAQVAINEQVNAVQAEWGFLVVMNAKTGELVAVAEDGSVDPNNVDAVDASRREARAFSYPYEPGSTFKSLTASALLNEGAATPLTQNLTPDHINPEPNVTFGDSFSHPPMRWTLTGILVNSSNVGTATLGVRLSPETRYKYLRKFGIGTATDVGMPVEDSGILRNWKDWDPQTNYNINFGQGVASTIVQTADAYQAIANDGVRVPPRLVESCTTADGKVTTYKKGKEVTVITPETAKSVRNMMETVVTEGWINKFVSIPGYRIAGKTGTAEQVDPTTGRYRTTYVNSFAGIFPADDPQYVAVSSVAFAHSGDGAVAALTAFRKAAEATIRTFHIPPSTESFTPLPVEY